MDKGCMSEALDIFMKQNMEMFDKLQAELQEKTKENERLKDDNLQLQIQIKKLEKFVSDIGNILSKGK